MRTTTSLRSPLAAFALLVAAAMPAAAQRAAADLVRPAVRTADAILRTVAIYRFNPAYQAGMPAQVTVADSSGSLVATFRLPGSATERPMMVELVNGDLVLQGETSKGVLTLVLYQNDRTGEEATIGRWILGDVEGELRGRSAH